MPLQISLVVYEPAKVDAVLRAWLEAGVTGLTIYDASGWVDHIGERYVRDDLPLFPSVREVMRGKEERNRVIFSIQPDDFDVEGLLEVTESVLGPLDEPGTGIFFVTPVSLVKGLRRSQEDPG